MCKCGEDEQILITKEIPAVCLGKVLDEPDALAVIYDARGYLRLVYADDYGCLDHGEEIEINYCHMCGLKIPKYFTITEHTELEVTDNSGETIRKVPHRIHTLLDGNYDNKESE